MFFFPTALLYAKSTLGIKRLSKKDRESFFLPPFIVEMLSGIMLGDGHVDQRSLKSNSRFKYGQSGLANKKEYFNHIFNILLPFCVPGLLPYIKTWFDERSQQTYTSISFATMQLACFNIFREWFYVNNVKIVGRPRLIIFCNYSLQLV